MRIEVPDRLRKVLTQLELLPHGTITNWSSLGGGKPDTRPPTGESEPPHLVFRRRYEACISPLSKERVIEEAEQELADWQARERLPVMAEESTVDHDQRMLREGRGWSPREVSLKFHCTPKYVERVRRTAGVATDTGEGVIIVADDDQEIRALIARGLSERQIRMFAGCGGSTIQRLKVAS